MSEIKKVLKKHRIELFRKERELVLKPASLSNPSTLVRAFNDVISPLNKILYNSLYALKIDCLPYCLLPCDTPHRNVYYQKDKKYRYSKTHLCLNCKYDKFCPGIIDDFKDSLTVKPIPDIPLEIIIQVTKKCNLNCKICAAAGRAAKSLPSSKIKEIIDEAKNLNVEAIRFTGGEPFIRDDIEELILYAKRKGFYIIVNTNGSLIEKQIPFMEKYVDNVLVSFQGCNSKSEKVFTGRDNLLKRRLRNILRLNNSRIPAVRTGTIISNYLIGHFDQYLKIVEALNVRQWELFRPMIKNESLSYYPEYDIRRDKFLKFLDNIYASRIAGLNIFIANPVPFCIAKKTQEVQLLFFGANFDEGHSRIFYDGCGYFKPSYYLDVKIGATIKEALHNPFLKKIKSLDYLTMKCKRCEFLKDCLGGSRYLAKEFRGSYYRPDPWMDNR
jgi:MoaA/NifB/PqqE/SkfB family radical SAM enzyme